MWCNCAYKVAYSSWYKRWWMAKSHLCVMGGNDKMKCVCVCVKQNKKGGEGKQTERRIKWQKKKLIALVDPGSKRRKEGEGGGREWGGKTSPFRQTARRSCCTVGCYVWECLNRDPGRVRSGAGRASRTSRGRERPRWQHGDGSSAEQSHLRNTETITWVKISKKKRVFILI